MQFSYSSRYSYTVSHFSYAPLFQGPYLLTKMLESTFSMINYLLTFYLFVDIKNTFRITHAKHSAASKAILLTLTIMHVQPERLYFLFAFCARHYPWWSLWQKNTKNNYFIQLNFLFSVVEFSKTVTFWRNAHFDVILTSVTIFKQGFLRKPWPAGNQNSKTLKKVMKLTNTFQS